MHLSCQKQAEKYLKGTILAILFKKPTYLKNPWAFSFKKPILPAGFLNGFFKWVFYLIQPCPLERQKGSNYNIFLKLESTGFLIPNM